MTRIQFFGWKSSFYILVGKKTLNWIIESSFFFTWQISSLQFSRFTATKRVKFNSCPKGSRSSVTVFISNGVFFSIPWTTRTNGPHSNSTSLLTSGSLQFISTSFQFWFQHPILTSPHQFSGRERIASAQISYSSFKACKYRSHGTTVLAVWSKNCIAEFQHFVS